MNGASTQTLTFAVKRWGPPPVLVNCKKCRWGAPPRSFDWGGGDSVASNPPTLKFEFPLGFRSPYFDIYLLRFIYFRFVDKKSKNGMYSDIFSSKTCDFWGTSPRILNRGDASPPSPGGGAMRRRVTSPNLAYLFHHQFQTLCEKIIPPLGYLRPGNQATKWLHIQRHFGKFVVLPRSQQLTGRLETHRLYLYQLRLQQVCFIFWMSVTLGHFIFVTSQV